MTECQRCSGRSTVFLCPGCQRELQVFLTGLHHGELLPSGHYAKGFLEYLEDAARGQTRLGVSVRHSTDYTGPLPFNEKASELLRDATEMLWKWVGAVNLNNETLGEA